MKNYYLTFSLLCSGLSLNAQQNSVAAGNDVSGAGGNISFSVGQIDYQSANGSNGTINQGVQQPFEIFNINSINELDLLITSVFPNPTNGIVQLTISSLKEHLDYALYDLSGRLLKQHPIVATQTNIDLSELASGEYLLQISNTNQQHKTLKIIKH